MRAVLIVLDGFGIGKDSPHNGIANARMPFYRRISRDYPHSQLITHGLAVGLPEGTMGNSEVGHMTIGSGRIIYQDLMRISRAIADGSFYSNEALKGAFLAASKSGGRVHLIGLLSDAGVHSHMEHLFALLEMGRRLGVPRLSVHPLLDGRDTPPDSSEKYLKQLLADPSFAPGAASRATIATVMGRYWGMDRDKRWERTERALDAMTGKGEAPRFATKTPALETVEKSHAAGKTDEFVEPVILDRDATMRDGDSLIFFNFRADRARQISKLILEGKRFTPSSYVMMTQYDTALEAPFAFAPNQPANTFGEVLERRGLRQFRLAETEKYAHVTFFFNGGREAPFRGEDRLMIPSPRDCATYDVRPEMSSREVADAAVERIDSAKYDFVLMNFANADMVGHTGSYEAVLRSMAALDRCLERVVGAAERGGAHVILTADHGNAEEMVDLEGRPHTQHTLNPVPAIWIAPGTAIAPRSSREAFRDGTLADIMPTLCELMKLPIPAEVTGKSLLPKGTVC